MIGLKVLKESYIKFMASQDCRYHLTIKFLHNTKKSICRKNLNILIRYLNRDLYKGRYKAGKQFLAGFAIEEFSAFENTVHFHILIKKCKYLPNFDSFLELVEKKIASIRKIDPKNCIVNPYLQSYYNLGDDGLENYVAKDFSLESLLSDDSPIGLLSESDVIF